MSRDRLLKQKGALEKQIMQADLKPVLLCDCIRNVSPDIPLAGCKKPPSPGAKKLTHYTIPDDAAEKISTMLGALEEDGFGV